MEDQETNEVFMGKNNLNGTTKDLDSDSLNFKPS